jgi:thiamine-phosphate pyrophosphorylase
MTTTGNTNDVVARADAIAADAHAGQKRRHGAPYISHPRAVTTLARDLAAFVDVAFDDDDVAGALLHDVIEDCDRYDQARLAKEVSPRAAAHAHCLTKTGKGDDATAAYYAAIATSAAATRVIKIADRLHNLSELHKADDAEKLERYVNETTRFVRPLAATFEAPARRILEAVVDDAIDNARNNGARRGLTELGAGSGVDVRRPGAGRGAVGLYVIVGPRGRGPAATVDDDIAALQKNVDAMCRGGAVRVQVRAKATDGLSDRAVLARVAVVRDVAGAWGTDVVVNDRADIAFGASVADAPVGVHVGDGDVPPRVARAILGPQALVGTSTHTLAQLQQMLDDGNACHVALGPMWASETKSGHADVVGLETLRAAARLSPRRRLVAIGGITSPKRAFDAAAAGADLVAVVSAVALDDVDAIHLMCRRLSLATAAGRAARETLEAFSVGA